MNGRLTLGENIAELAGLAAAYDAYRRSLGGKPAPAVQGFTGDQQFFISFARDGGVSCESPPCATAFSQQDVQAAKNP